MVYSDVIEFTFPSGSWLEWWGAGDVTGVFYPAMEGGTFVMLKPLSPGEHTVKVFVGGFNMTFHLTVVPKVTP